MRMRVCLAVVVMGLSLPDLSAQEQEQPAPPREFRGGKLEAPPPSDKDQRDFLKMVRGQEDAPTNAERRKELFERVLRYLIYRLTWENIHDGRDQVTTREIMEGTPGAGVDGIFEAFPPANYNRQTDDPEDAARRERQRRYMNEMRGYATHYLREVLQNRLLIARLNAAIVLHRFAVYGQEEVADEFLWILENPNEHDAIKHWAVKGIGELFVQIKNPKVPKRLDRCALAVHAWLEAKTQVPPTQVAELSEPEKDAIRYLRREAVRTLALYRRPVIVEDAKANAREGPVAGLLVRILVNAEGTVSPPASLAERKEAAEALCNLQHKRSETYQPDYVVYQVARFIAVLGSEADRDPGRNSQRWKAFAAQLKAAWDNLSDDLKNSPHSQYVNRLSGRVNPVLEYIFDETKGANAVPELNEFLANNPPKSGDVYGQPPAKQPGG